MNKTSNQDMLVKITTKGIWKFSIHKNGLKSYFFKNDKAEFVCRCHLAWYFISNLVKFFNF